MKKSKFFILGCCFLIHIPFSLNSQTLADDPSWSSTPTLDEQFDGSFDYNSWTPTYWISHDYADHNFYFIPDNVDWSNNKLVLNATYHPNDLLKPVHSGNLQSSSPIYGYGYYEISCKLNCSGAFLPAFWFHHGQDCWSNEVDVFETYATNYTITSNIHINKQGTCDEDLKPIWGYEEFSTTNISPSLTQSYHSYGLEWLPGKFICYLDGIPYRYTSHDSIPNHDLYMFITLGFMHNTSGMVDINSLNFPASMEIEYVKKHDIIFDDAIVNQCNFDSENYDYALKRSITIGGSDCTPTIESGQKVTLRATDFITLDKGFTVESGAIFNAITHKEY